MPVSPYLAIGELAAVDYACVVHLIDNHDTHPCAHNSPRLLRDLPERPVENIRRAAILLHELREFLLSAVHGCQGAVPEKRAHATPGDHIFSMASMAGTL